MARIEIQDLQHDEKLDAQALERVRGGARKAGEKPLEYLVNPLGPFAPGGITDGTSQQGIIAILIG